MRSNSLSTLSAIDPAIYEQELKLTWMCTVEAKIHPGICDLRHE